MRVDKVLHACDDNPVYFDFWPIVSKLWREVFKIEPVLLYFGDKDVDDTYGQVVKLKGRHEGHLNSLCARYWYPSTEPETTFMISDIDMLPMSKFFFIEQIRNIDSEKYVHLVGQFRPIPSCYHIAKGKLFKEILDIPDSLEGYIDNCIQNSAGETHGVFDYAFDNWNTDEYYATTKVDLHLKQTPDRFVLLDRQPGARRLCRDNWTYIESDILQNKFFDCHSLRPYTQYKSQVDRVIELIEESYR